MTPDQISAWAAAGESETLELKRTTGERREAARTLCAMLNHRGGRVLFGIEANGRVVGQQVSDHTIEEVAHELRAIDPPAFPTIDRVPLGNGREVLVVSVSTGQNRPYSYRGQAYRRVGNTSQPLSRDEYNRMLLERVHGEQRWENEPAMGWSVTDLDAAEITRTLEEAIRRGRAEDPGTRELEEILRGLGLMKKGALLRAALVLFGCAERLATELPQCLLRVARFAGTDKTEFRDNRQFRGNAFELLLAAERFLRDHVPVASRIVPEHLARVDEPLYPPLAVREALANASAIATMPSAGAQSGSRSMTTVSK
ncbi:MAG: RNA-binding domain-containing protein [Thermoanaerobaculia bacterium]